MLLLAGLQMSRLVQFLHAQIIPQHLVQPGLERLSSRYSWFPPLQKVRTLLPRTGAWTKVGPGAPFRSTHATCSLRAAWRSAFLTANDLAPKQCSMLSTARAEHDRLACLGAQTAPGYTVVAATLMGFLCGFTQLLMGSPGDLPETVRAIHERGRIPVNQAPCMFILLGNEHHCRQDHFPLRFQPSLAHLALLCKHVSVVV